MERRAAILILATAAILPLGARRGAAQVTTDAGASILFFPYVVADGQRDTLIEIANRSTRVLYALHVHAGRGGRRGHRRGVRDRAGRSPVHALGGLARARRRRH